MVAEAEAEAEEAVAIAYVETVEEITSSQYYTTSHTKSKQSLLTRAQHNTRTKKAIFDLSMRAHNGKRRTRAIALFIQTELL